MSFTSFTQKITLGLYRTFDSAAEMYVGYGQPSLVQVPNHLSDLGLEGRSGAVRALDLIGLLHNLHLPRFEAVQRIMRLGGMSSPLVGLPFRRNIVTVLTNN